MNLLDVVLLLLAVSAVTVGLRMGLLARLSGWIGLAAGVGLATVTVPAVLARVDAQPGPNRILLALAVLLVTVWVVAGIGAVIGRRLRAAVEYTVLGGPDRLAGAVVGLAGLVAVVWILAPAGADVPGSMARQVRGSAMVATVDALLPDPPPVTDTLATAVSGLPFPDVLGPLQSAPDLGPPPAELGVTPGVVDRVTHSTLNVEGRGCGLLFGEGTGWVVEPGLVVTNAHVVSELAEVGVRRDDGTVLPATVVARDDQRDLALLRVRDLDRPPLDRTEPVPGERALVAGHPGGQDQVRVAPARVDRVQSTVGQGLDGRPTTRQVVFLAAELIQGDSGAPVANTDGEVIATAFAIAPDVPTTAYAIGPGELDVVLASPRAPVEPRTC